MPVWRVSLVVILRQARDAGYLIENHKNSKKNISFLPSRNLASTHRWWCSSCVAVHCGTPTDAVVGIHSSWAHLCTFYQGRWLGCSCSAQGGCRWAQTRQGWSYFQPAVDGWSSSSLSWESWIEIVPKKGDKGNFLWFISLCMIRNCFEFFTSWIFNWTHSFYLLNLICSTSVKIVSNIRPTIR